MVYAENNDELNISFNKILQHPLTNEFPRFRTYVERLFERKSEWAICLRVNLITRGQNTNNISEAGVKIMKDVVLDRAKAILGEYSPVQLFFFIVQDLDTFYKMKILDVAANRPPQYLKKRFLITKIQQKSLKYEAVQSSDSLYLVHNTLKNTTYNIDLDTGLCSCPQGNTGKSCKHQIFVAKDLKRELGLCLPVTEEIRNKLHVIATGCSEIQDGWYSSTSEKITTDKCINVQHDHAEIEKENDQILQSNLITENASYDYNVTKFNEMIEKIKITCLSDVEYFLPGMNNMVKSFDKTIRTHSSLLSAMMTFGKCSGVEPNSKRMKLIGNKHIGIQPTACSRRSTQIGGRKNLAAGRVPKWKRVTEHGYTQKPSSSKLPRTKLNIK